MTPWVLRLIAANVLVFFLETIPGVTERLAFVPVLFPRQPWTAITYMFVHDPHSLMHILFNMLSLYFFGPRVEERLGGRRFMTLYGLSGITGALLSAIFAPNVPIIGASGAVFGVMVAFAMFWPTAQIYIFGIIPLEARVALILMVLYSLWSGFTGSRMGIADFAHLGGVAGGWFYIKWLGARRGAKQFRSKATATVGKEKLLNWKRVDPKTVHEVNRDEVNRILDKISDKGVDSLTAQERLFLSNFVPPDDRVPPKS